jgi:large subunit ribosomal protein L29
MKMTTLRDMTKEELLQKKHELKDDLFNLRLRKSLKELENPLRLRTLKRDIARIETILTEDSRDIRKIVDSKVSILDQSTGGETENKNETSE